MFVPYVGGDVFIRIGDGTRRVIANVISINERERTVVVEVDQYRTGPVDEAVGKHPECRKYRGRRRCRWCDMRDALHEIQREDSK